MKGMLEIIIIGLVLVLGFLFIGDTEITFSPFTIKMNAPLNAIGWFLLSIGVACISANSRQRGHKEGVKETMDNIVVHIDKRGTTKPEDLK
jgi:small neutral amino acid transporter SnatA (MarC family)